MYNVSSAFREAIYQSPIRLLGKVQVVGGDLFEVQIVSIQLNELSNSGDDLIVGSCCNSTVAIDFRNTNGSLDEKYFNEKTIIPSIGVELPDESVEYVPLGVFLVTNSIRKDEVTVSVSASDRMSLFNTDYSTAITFPCTLLQLLQDLCQSADVSLATTSFPNAGYVLDKDYTVSTTRRNMLGYIAQAAGCFARFNRAGALELRWYASSPLAFNPANYVSLEMSDYTVPGISKLTVKTEEDDLGLTVGAGSVEYSIINNPLLYGLTIMTAEQWQPVLQAILDNIKDFSYRAIKMPAMGNPAVMAGDIVTITNVNDLTVTVPITKHTFSYNGGARDLIEATGTDPTKKPLKGTVNEKITALNKKSNILTRTLDETVSRVEQTYTKDETTYEIGTRLAQTKDEIVLSADEKYLSKADFTLSPTEIEGRVSNSGGSNCFKNSCGASSTDFWTTTGTVSTASLSGTSSLSGVEFKIGTALTAGSILQTVPAATGVEYTVSFLYKKLAGAVTINAKSNQDNVIPIPSTAVNSWTKMTFKFTTGATYITFQISSAFQFEITDLLLAPGSVEVWSQYPGEIYTAGFKLDSRGMQIENSQSNSVVNIDSSSFTATNKSSHEEIFGLKWDRAHVKNLESDGEVSAGKGRMFTLGTDTLVWVIND